MELAFLQTELLGNTVQSWLAATLTTVVVFAALLRARTVVVRRLEDHEKRTPNRHTAGLAGVISRTRVLFLMTVAVWAGSYWLALPKPAIAIFVHAAIIAVLLQLGVWGNSFLPILVDSYVRLSVPDPASQKITTPALTFVGRLALWAVIGVLALENMGVHVSALVASLGIGGVAVAFASQSILGDLFASMSIIFDRPFLVGDYVVIDDLEGDVEKIGLRTTHVRSLGGEQLVFSNHDLLSTRIRNFRRMSERRISFTLDLVYSTPFEKLSRVPDMLEDIINKEDAVRFDRAHFKAYVASSLRFEVVYWVTNREYRSYMDAQQRINFAIYERFESEGIEFAYPTQTLYLERDAAQSAATQPAAT